MDPLVFTPYLCPKEWGSRRLRDVLHKPLPPDGTWGESWEISSHPSHETCVAEGPCTGISLTTLCQQHGRDLFGPTAPTYDAFPLLLKYLDANDLLSVQVHPNDDQAMALAKERFGKTEAWVVIASRSSQSQNAADTTTAARRASRRPASRLVRQAGPNSTGRAQAAGSSTEWSPDFPNPPPT